MSEHDAAPRLSAKQWPLRLMIDRLTERCRRARQPAALERHPRHRPRRKFNDRVAQRLGREIDAPVEPALLADFLDELPHLPGNRIDVAFVPDDQHPPRTT